MTLLPPQPICNGDATARHRSTVRPLLLSLLCVISVTGVAHAQQTHPDNEKTRDGRAEGALTFLGGAATALGLHEAAHLAFDLGFGAHPGLKGVDFAGIPFFAITHREVSPRREFVISSAGFWMQHVTDEWLLTTRRGLREERAPFAKGLLAFNVLASVAYGGVALARTGPDERDTRGMARSLGRRGVDERTVGVLVLAPAVLDTYRYFVPDSRWAAWASRAVKVGMVLLVIR